MVKIEKRSALILIFLLALALAIRFYPPMTNDFLVNFDSVYHARIGQMTADAGWVPSWDYAAGGRPQLYPPFYHLVLGYLSIASGIPVFEIIKYLLPLISALFILPAFYLARTFRDEETALWVAAFVALNPVVASQSYDSPQLFGFLLLPIIARLFLKGSYLVCGVLLGVSLLFNYFIAATIAVVLLAYGAVKYFSKDRNLITYGKAKMPLVYAGLSIAIGIGLASPWLFIAASRAGECLDVSTAVSSIAAAGMGNLLVMVPFVAIIGFVFLYMTKQSKDDYALFWKICVALGVVGFYASLAFPWLHSYDQILLAGFALPFLLPEMKLRESTNIAILILALVASVFAVAAISPSLSDGDLGAVYWIKGNVAKGDILANPEISASINTLTMSKSLRTEFDLFLECVPDSQRWTDMYGTLMTADKTEARAIIDKYGVDYVIVGDRDVWNYHFDTNKFTEMGYPIAFSSAGTKIYQVTPTP